MTRLIFSSILSLSLLSSSCDGPKERVEVDVNAVPQIYVTNAFLFEIADGLAGDWANVQWVCPDDPRHCFPDQELVIRMQSADMIILNGGAYEAWVQQISLPGDVIVNSAFHFRDRWIEDESEVRHSHGGHEHRHSAYNPYFWLNPELAKLQMEEICRKMETSWPERSNLIYKRRVELEERLNSLDSICKSLRSGLVGKTIYYDGFELNYLLETLEVEVRSISELKGSRSLEQKSLIIRDNDFHEYKIHIDVCEEFAEDDFFDRMRMNLDILKQAENGPI